MDSFYDAPRRAPIPTQIETFLPTPVVPEVSILGSSKIFPQTFSPYSSWKTSRNRGEGTSLSPNEKNTLKVQQIVNQTPINPQNTSQFLKKQVRFESPILQQKPLAYEPFDAKKLIVGNCINAQDNKSKENCRESNLHQGNSPFSRGTLMPIYAHNINANVPNRNLDLSLIDIPSNGKKEKGVVNCITEKTETLKTKHIGNHGISENKENLLPRTYRDFLTTQKKIVEENEDLDSSVKDIFNYKRKDFGSGIHPDKEKCEDFDVVNSNFDKILDTNRVKEVNTYNLKFGGNALQRDLCKHQVQLNVDSRFCESKSNNSPIYHKNDFSSKSDRVVQTSIDFTPKESYQSGSKNADIRNDTEPSNRDLLKIIAQQNEQLLILQRQVAMLLNRDEQRQHKQIEAPSHQCIYMGEKYVTSTQNEPFKNTLKEIDVTPKKQRPLSKFSIDLMTSFEVAIRPQHKQNFINQEPKIQEITESENGNGDNFSAVDKCEKTLVDTSLHLQEPVKVREMCPSPEPTININMNDYDSSDDDEISSSELGATFYRNLMGQVNDILRKAQAQTSDELKNGKNCDGKFKNHTMNRVKEATLKHLKNIGVTVGPVEAIEEGLSPKSDGEDFTPTEISFAVKQLLMKYLPDDQLAKITCKKSQPQHFNKMGKPGIIATRPEFSFASVEYMKKYNLISNNDVKARGNDQIPKAQNPQKLEGPKILDMTALKMQPKLL